MLREQRETSGPSAKANNHTDGVSSHKDTPKALPFHRPFEKAVPNGYNKEILKVPDPQADSKRNFYDEKPHLHSARQRLYDDSRTVKDGSHPEFTYRLNTMPSHLKPKDVRTDKAGKPLDRSVDKLKRPLLNGPPALVPLDSPHKAKKHSLSGKAPSHKFAFSLL
jgi:hypothetical protein